MNRSHTDMSTATFKPEPLAQRLAAEVRAGDPMARRRAALRAAAPLADGRTEVLRALEDHLLARLAATAPPEPR